MMKRKYVNSIEDYYYHTSLHIKRVELLAWQLYKQNYNRYKTVSPFLLLEFLKLHDHTKIQGKFLNELYPYYGDKSHLKSKDWRHFKKLIKELNQKDKKILTNFFKDNKIKMKDRALFLEIEKIADLVDRNLNEVTPEEFGKNIENLKNYLNSKEIKLASNIIKNYKKITKDYFYKKIKVS